jgi:hypothetical protein
VPQTQTQARDGVLEIDGDSVDTEGVFVPVNRDELCAAEHTRLQDLWEQQREDARKRNEERRAKMDDAVPSILLGGGVTLNGPQPSVDGDSGHHSMVLLGTYKEDRKANFRKGRKNTFYLCF